MKILDDHGSMMLKPVTPANEVAMVALDRESSPR